MTTPGPAGVAAVHRRLRAQQGRFVPKPVLPALDEVVATVLSQHTSDINSGRAFARLKEIFPSWEQVADAPAEDLADAIRCGGIADQKARRIKQILAAIEEREGRISLDRLAELDDAAAAAYLESLPGVGPKTAACVLTFALGRAAFPVDTHVHRIAIRLGWIPAKTTADAAHRLLARDRAGRASAMTCTSRWSPTAARSAGRSGRAATDACFATCAPSDPPGLVLSPALRANCRRDVHFAQRR